MDTWNIVDVIDHQRLRPVLRQWTVARRAGIVNVPDTYAQSLRPCIGNADLQPLADAPVERGLQRVVVVVRAPGIVDGVRVAGIRTIDVRGTSRLFGRATLTTVARRVIV